MKVKMKSLYAGPAGVMMPDEIYDVNESLGGDLIEYGYAVRVDAAAPAPAPVPVRNTQVETADLPDDAEQEVLISAFKKRKGNK